MPKPINERTAREHAVEVHALKDRLNAAMSKAVDAGLRLDVGASNLPLPEGRHWNTPQFHIDIALPIT